MRNLFPIGFLDTHTESEWPIICYLYTMPPHRFNIFTIQSAECGEATILTNMKNY